MSASLDSWQVVQVMKKRFAENRKFYHEGMQLKKI